MDHLEKPERQLKHSPDPYMDLYLRDISAYPQLSKAEELELAIRIRNPSSDDDKQKAIQCLINSNLRLVVSIARRYASMRIPIMDIITEGNLGLIRAAELFDPEKFNAKFSTYATNWIKQSIQRALIFRFRLSIPTYLIADINAHQKQTPRYAWETPEAWVMRLPGVDKLRRRTMIAALRAMVPVDDIDDRIVSDKKAGDAAKRAINNEIHELIYEGLRFLDQRSQQIIIKRFGLDGDYALTVAETAQELGISYQRVCQIQDIALKKLYFIYKGCGLSRCAN